MTSSDHGGNDESTRQDSAPEFDKCPKCFNQQLDTKHCSRCGLDLSYAARHNLCFDNMPPDKEAEAKQAQALWQQIEEDPTGGPRHEDFFDYCTNNGLLELAVRRYRERAVDFPDDPLSSEFLARATKRLESSATLVLESSQWSPNFARRVELAKRLLLLLAVLLFVGGVIVAIMLYQKQQAFLPPGH